MTKCDSTSAITARWSLRDPDGNWVIAPTNHVGTLIECDMGPMVLPTTGVYVLTLAGGTTAETYSFKVNHLAHLQELPQPGQPVPAPTITRLDPASGPAGGSTTIHLFGKNMPAPAVVHVFKGSVQLPVTLNEVRSTHGSTEAEVASARVDLSNAAPGRYLVSVDLPGGITLIAPSFLVTAAPPPSDPITVSITGISAVARRVQPCNGDAHEHERYRCSLRSRDN